MEVSRGPWVSRSWVASRHYPGYQGCGVGSAVHSGGWLRGRAAAERWLGVHFEARPTARLPATRTAGWRVAPATTGTPFVDLNQAGISAPRKLSILPAPWIVRHHNAIGGGAGWPRAG